MKKKSIKRKAIAVKHKVNKCKLRKRKKSISAYIKNNNRQTFLFPIKMTEPNLE